MGKAKTPSFVTECALVVSSDLDKKLLAKFQAARQLYNACLAESMVRMSLLKDSRLYQQAKEIPRKEKKKRQSAFSKARLAVRYREYDLHSFASITAKSSKWIYQQLDSNIIQTVATRAFKASEKVLLGTAKRVRFKSATRFRSVENKTDKFGLRWRDNQVVWGDLTIQAIMDWDNPVIVHGLKSRVKYCRLLYRVLNGKRRWFVQLINEGLPYQKPKNYVSEGLVGIDLNVSTVAIVGDNHAELAPFCLKIENKQREIAVLPRKMSRSERTNNPNNFEPDFVVTRGTKQVKKKGKVKKGRKKWKNSNQYKRTKIKLAELHRKQKAQRKTEQRQLVNRILRLGNHVKMEKVSVKGWQKRWGKAIGCKAPGFFQSELVRFDNALRKRESLFLTGGWGYQRLTYYEDSLSFKLSLTAESAGGLAEKFSTRNTKLSQTCVCGRVAKKPLSQRIHKCECGIITHRDLMSGYLSRHVNQGELCATRF